MKIPGKYVRKENGSTAILKRTHLSKSRIRSIKKAFSWYQTPCFPSWFLVLIADVIISALKTTNVFILITVHWSSWRQTGFLVVISNQIVDNNCRLSDIVMVRWKQTHEIWVFLKCEYFSNQKTNKPQMLHLKSKNHHVCCLDKGVSETTSG